VAQAVEAGMEMIAIYANGVSKEQKSIAARMGSFQLRQRLCSVGHRYNRFEAMRAWPVLSMPVS
jgi:hypothetical protein